MKKNLLEERYKEVKTELRIYRTVWLLFLTIVINGLYHKVMYISASYFFIGLFVGLLILNEALFSLTRKVYKYKKTKMALTPSKDA